VGFAANSILCRMALGQGATDPSTFTSVRLVSGALVLALLSRTGGAAPAAGGSWPGATSLFVYAAAFSLAYVRLPVATGVLILFGAVQVTMLGWALKTGERPGLPVWIGLAAAAGGLVVLTRPGLAAPDRSGAALMALAGVGWGIYSLLGRRASNPLGLTAGNFLLSVPFCLLLSAATIQAAHTTPRGVLLAMASGAGASGLGYSLWYAALPRLSAARAAVAQLVVPPLAAAGGALLLGESLSQRLFVGGGLILAGVTFALFAPGPASHSPLAR
jgi:drug/metabolite transporter (DMT)-like permease